MTHHECERWFTTKKHGTERWVDYAEVDSKSELAELVQKVRELGIQCRQVTTSPSSSWHGPDKRYMLMMPDKRTSDLPPYLKSLLSSVINGIGKQEEQKKTLMNNIVKIDRHIAAREAEAAAEPKEEPVNESAQDSDATARKLGLHPLFHKLVSVDGIPGKVMDVWGNTARVRFSDHVWSNVPLDKVDPAELKAPNAAQYKEYTDAD